MMEKKTRISINSQTRSQDEISINLKDKYFETASELTKESFLNIIEKDILVEKVEMSSKGKKKTLA